MKILAPDDVAVKNALAGKLVLARGSLHARSTTVCRRVKTDTDYNLPLLPLISQPPCQIADQPPLTLSGSGYCGTVLTAHNPYPLYSSQVEIGGNCWLQWAKLVMVISNLIRINLVFDCTRLCWLANIEGTPYEVGDNYLYGGNINPTGMPAIFCSIIPDEDISQDADSGLITAAFNLPVNPDRYCALTEPPSSQILVTLNP